MKYLRLASLIFLPVVLAACSTGGVATLPDAVPGTADNANRAPGSVRDTVLLVSLDDGRVIKQSIRSSAELCFKRNSESATTCLTQGAPVFDPVTAAVIGYQMIEDRIDLVAGSN